MPRDSAIGRESSRESQHQRGHPARSWRMRPVAATSPSIASEARSLLTGSTCRSLDPAQLGERPGNISYVTRVQGREDNSMTRLTLVALGFLVAAAGMAEQQVTRAELRALADRRAAPSLRLVDASQKVVRLSDFHGKPVVLNFWATECGGCKVELPTLAGLARTYKRDGLAVVGVSMDITYSDLRDATAGWSQVTSFLGTHRLDYPILLDDGSAEQAFGVTALPATYLLDRAGRIAADVHRDRGTDRSRGAHQGAARGTVRCRASLLESSAAGRVPPGRASAAVHARLRRDRHRLTFRRRSGASRVSRVCLARNRPRCRLAHPERRRRQPLARRASHPHNSHQC